MVQRHIAVAFKDGAEFGYNKAKEEMQEQGLALQSDMDKTIEQNIALKRELEKANDKIEALEERCEIANDEIIRLQKINEWHYPSKGEYLKDEKNFQSYVVAYYGVKGSIANGKPCWEEQCYDTENKRWVDKETLDDIPYVNQEGIVIAWKEIVLSDIEEDK